MSRDIKFRGWDGGMFYNIVVDGEVWTDSLVVDNWHSDNIMQFTGLMDKNNYEIYEGDIVKFHYFFMSFGQNMGAQESEHELIGIVEWQEYGYGISAIKGEHWCGYTGFKDGEGKSDFLHLVTMSESSTHEESFEVIGNIYENPELIPK